MKTDNNPKSKGSSAAYRLNLSPDEWTWTQEEQEEMARDLLEAFAVNKALVQAVDRIAKAFGVEGQVHDVARKIIARHKKALGQSTI
jgi:sarcosine oxidase gamma subunit